MCLSYNFSRLVPACLFADLSLLLSSYLQLFAVRFFVAGNDDLVIAPHYIRPA
jgi:hypothetical protein